jgi:NADH:ubiquinone oxidoreductase subunit 2 (subunit N)
MMEGDTMGRFRILLAAIFVTIAGYTAIVVANHGMNLLPVFFGDMGTMAWPGQFNVDFLCMLMLSGLWVAWRHEFTPAGMALGLLALFGGAFFLSAYLLIVTAREQDVRALLLGPGRV